MSFKWRHKCFQCDRPVDVYFSMDGDYRLIAPFFLFHSRVPLHYQHNKMYYKFYGLKVKRVCYGCFSNKLNFNPQVDLQRRIGMRVQFLPKNYAKTSEEIENWNKMFSRYLKNRL